MHQAINAFLLACQCTPQWASRVNTTKLLAVMTVGHQVITSARPLAAAAHLSR